MLPRHSWAKTLTVSALAVVSVSSPLTKPGTSVNPSLLKRNTPTYIGCSNDQQNQIKQAITDLTGLAAFAVEQVSMGGFNANKGYSHYFNEGDRNKVLAVFRAGLNAAAVPGTSVRWNFKCGTDDDCKSPGASSFAITDIIPEDFEAPDASPPIGEGIRTMLMCPLFFSDPRTKRTLPSLDKNKIAEYCALKESKNIRDFESGAHTLLHEISHLDTFGILAGLAAEDHDADDATKYPAFTSHGTVDWRNKGDPGNARLLKTSKAKNKPDTFENAESIAASATEMYAMSVCGLSDVPP